MKNGIQLNSKNDKSQGNMSPVISLSTVKSAC
jgi:hypothetical protein